MGLIEKIEKNNEILHQIVSTLGRVMASWGILLIIYSVVAYATNQFWIPLDRNLKIISTILGCLGLIATMVSIYPAEKKERYVSKLSQKILAPIFMLLALFTILLIISDSFSELNSYLSSVIYSDSYVIGLSMIALGGTLIRAFSKEKKKK